MSHDIRHFERRPQAGVEKFGGATKSVFATGFLRSLRSVEMAIVLLFAASAIKAQTPDAVFNRARQMVVGGNGAAGRLLIDSVLSATPSDSPVYGDALYWRAAFAVTSADAERDYTRLVIEFPLSSHTGEALVQLAQIQSARGDRADAARNLQRFLLENPKSAERPKAQLQLVRLFIEQNDLPRGCSTLQTALAETPKSAVEQRNQLEYYSPRCAANDVGPGGRVPVGPTMPMPATPTRDSARRDSIPAKAKEAATGHYTLQIAAYKSRSEAETLAKKLKTRKLEARVVPSGKLYRVRLGRYATRTAALAAQKELKAKKIDGFITEIGPDDK